MELNKQVGNDNGLKEMYNIWWTILTKWIVINFILNTSIKTGIVNLAQVFFLFSSFEIIIVQSKKIFEL